MTCLFFMITRQKPLVALLPVLFTMSSAGAQQSVGANANSQTYLTVPSITVYASRFEEALVDTLPQTSIVTAAEIQKSGASNVSEVLLKVAGLPMRLNLDGSTNAVIDMRGYGDTAFNNVVVLLDGVRLSENEQTAARTSMIPLEAIDHIEITKTGNSVLYGDGATGGTINIVTRKNVGNLTVVSGGLASYSGYQSSIYHSQALDESEVSIFAKQYASDNYRQNSKGTELSMGANWIKHIDFQTDVGTRFFTSQERNKLPGALPSIYLNSSPRDSQVPGYNWNSDVDSNFLTFFGKKTIQNVELAIDLNQRIRRNINSYRYDAHTVYSGYNYDSQWHDSYGNSSSRAKSQSISPRIKINDFMVIGNVLQMGYDWSNTKKNGNAFLTFGCSSGTCSIANNTGSSQYEIEHQTRGFYFRDIWDMSNTDRITAGYRQESYSQNYAIDYGGYGSSYGVARTAHASELEYSKKLHTGLTGYMRLSENFRIANADDSSNAAQDNFYNPVPLQVQTSRDVDVGLNQKTDFSVTEISYFHSHIKNEIGFDPVGCGYGCNVNFDPTQREGVNFKQHLTLSKEFTLRTNLQYIRSKFVDGAYSAKFVPGVAPFSGNFALDYQMSPKEQITWTARFAASRYMSGDFLNTQSKVPGYGVQDVSYFYKEKSWSIVASLMNLFDKKYADSGFYKPINTPPYDLTVYPNPGRRVSLTGRYVF